MLLAASGSVLQSVETQRHCPLVRIQALKSRHVRHRGAKALQAGGRQGLHSHLLLEAVQRHPAVHPGVAVGGEHVVGAGGVVPHRLGSPGPQEHAAGVVHQGKPFLRVLGVDDQVLRCVPVAELHGFRLGVDADDAGVGERLAGGVTAGQGVALGVHLPLHRLQVHPRQRHQHHLTVRPMLGLGQQVGGDEDGGRGGISDD
mmetsp:Transcript_10125/g.30317  ORF Transcript_10125/g.30317 Transcript_10125/m.30317 type:complete len:201 (-) Transcript_10125:1002-1604(-)